MNLAKVTTARQITIPMDIYKLLKLKPGNKLLFIERDGEVIVKNASVEALEEAQRNFRGAAEAAGITSDEDVMNLVREIRYGERAK